jgi:thioredoxin reductase
LERTLSPASIDIAIIGAGPYGLSLAAHLKRSARRFRIFGEPMQFWTQHMPRGMCLKSEGFASSLYDPHCEFTLQAYCAENSIPYADIGLPVPIETFVAYAQEFQRRYVPQLENVQINSLASNAEHFELTTAAGEVVCARQVVVAAGIMNFAHLPPQLQAAPASMVTHSSQHSDLTGFKGRAVAVIGAGASALDMAMLLQQAGAAVHLIARRSDIPFHDPPNEPRPLIERIKAPRSGLGTGWRSRMCTDIPLVFHAMPESLRLRVVERHLGPAPCWFVRDAVVGRLPMHLGALLTGVRARDGGVQVDFSQRGENRHLEVDHVVAATGYKVAISRLRFLHQAMQSRIRKVADTPILSRQFETSVPGLYFIGAAAANSFGPLLRFAFGANFAAGRLARRLANA